MIEAEHLLAATLFARVWLGTPTPRRPQGLVVNGANAGAHNARDRATFGYEGEP